MSLSGPLLLAVLAAPGCVESLDAADGSPDAVVEDGRDAMPGPLLIDDFSSCDPALASAIGATWYAFEDRDRPEDGVAWNDCNHGSSTSAVELLHEGTGSSGCALRWSGEVTTAFEYGFAGVGIDISSVDLTRFGRLVLVVRGDGEYRLKLPMAEQAARAQAGPCGNGDWNFFGATFRCGDGTSAWVETAFDLRAPPLAQESGWGTPWTFDKADVSQIQIQTIGQPIASFRCDIGAVRLEP